MHFKDLKDETATLPSFDSVVNIPKANLDDLIPKYDEPENTVDIGVELHKIKELLTYIARCFQLKDAHKVEAKEWQALAIVMDRFFFFCTLLFLVFPLMISFFVQASLDTMELPNAI